jgi:hypothetical protein
MENFIGFRLDFLFNYPLIYFASFSFFIVGRGGTKYSSSTIEILKTVGDLNRKKFQIIEFWLKLVLKKQLRLHRFTIADYRQYFLSNSSIYRKNSETIRKDFLKKCY